MEIFVVTGRTGEVWYVTDAPGAAYDELHYQNKFEKLYYEYYYYTDDDLKTAELDKKTFIDHFMVKNRFRLEVTGHFINTIVTRTEVG